MLKHLLVLFYVLSITSLPGKLLEADALATVSTPLTASSIPDLPIRADLPIFHKPHWKHAPPYVTPGLELVPAQPPKYGPLVTYAHPPSSSHLSRPSMKKSGVVPPTAGLLPPKFDQIAPTQSSASSIPLAQPPLSPQTSGKNSIFRREIHRTLVIIIMLCYCHFCDFVYYLV